MSVTVTFTDEQAAALADHPATLHPSDPGTFWVNAVKEAVAVLNAARRWGGMGTPHEIEVWVCPSGRHTSWPRPGSEIEAMVRTHETDRAGNIIAPLCEGQHGGACGDCRMVKRTYVVKEEQ